VAAEVVRLNGELDRLSGQVERAWETYLGLFASWRDTRRRRDELAARVRAAAFAAGGNAGTPATVPTRATVPTPARVPVPATAPGSARPTAHPAAAPVRPEASTRTVQNLLFVLGGLLLGAAAIVFTAVAWATVGVVGRAAILAAVTGLTLAVPVPTVRRRLTATAETFASVGLLLVVALLARRVVGWLAYGFALLVSTVFGLAALAAFYPAGRPVLAGGPLLVVVLLLAAGAAGLLPSLVSVLVVGDQPWRRLLLGIGALVAVLAGAGWRRQAPVLLGGAALTVVALREVAAGWDLLPRWIFLAVGGLILVGLAASYERRRRDLGRLRAALARMT
jgi:hypothetical protein